MGTGFPRPPQGTFSQVPGEEDHLDCCRALGHWLWVDKLPADVKHHHLLEQRSNGQLKAGWLPPGPDI